MLFRHTPAMLIRCHDFLSMLPLMLLITPLAIIAYFRALFRWKIRFHAVTLLITPCHDA